MRLLVEEDDWWRWMAMEWVGLAREWMWSAVVQKV
jgi:hypothetical protein